MEQYWHDVHVTLLGEIRGALSRELPDDLYVSVEERLQVETFLDDENQNGTRVADVAITERWRKGLPPLWSPEGEKEGAVMMADPEVISIIERKERWLEIRSAKGKGEIITVIEVLSPSNKRGQGREEYLDKTESLRQGEVNLVEIDLLRGGKPTAGIPHYETKLNEMGGIVVFRAAKPFRLEYYRCLLRQRLPAFRVPLRGKKDPDMPLDLQPMIDYIYESGRYWRLEGQLPLAPPLSPEDEAWVKECLAVARTAQQS